MPVTSPASGPVNPFAEPEMLPLIVLLSSLVGAAIGVGLVVFKGRDHQVPLAFGPFLAIAGAIALFFGRPLVALYLPGSS